MTVIEEQTACREHQLGLAAKLTAALERHDPRITDIAGAKKCIYLHLREAELCQQIIETHKDVFGL